MLNQNPLSNQSMADQYLEHKSAFTDWMKSLTKRVRPSAIIEEESEPVIADS